MWEGATVSLIYTLSLQRNVTPTRLKRYQIILQMYSKSTYFLESMILGISQ